jgi:glycerophosphoryl diester phosphodiesterase
MKVFAHRGASARLPENTMLAFRQAVADGADGVELDVMRCKSGELIVFHDETLDRLGNRPESPRDLDWRTLRQVKILDQGHIPLLEEVLTELGPQVEINIELKTHPNPLLRLIDQSLAESVAEMVARMRLADRVIVSSFDPLLLWRFASLADHVRTALLLSATSSRPLREGWALSLYPTGAVHPEAALVTSERLDRWRKRGRAIRVWTVDHPAEIRWLDAHAVDAVITNEPALAIAALRLPPR